MKVKEESEKAGLRLKTFRKLRSWYPVPSLCGETVETVTEAGHEGRGKSVSPLESHQHYSAVI